MANIKRANTSGITKSGAAISDVPDAPTIGAVTDVADGTSVTVAYTAAVTGGTATTFTATSTPGSLTGTGSSPITVTGLTSGTAYTFKVKGTNSTATGPESAASASVTLTFPPTGAWDSIAATTLNSTTASITFSSIPQTYTHLQIRGISRCNRAVSFGNSMQVQFNGDTGSNYFQYHYLYGDGSATGAGAGNLTTQAYVGSSLGSSALANTFSTTIIDILDYKNTNKYKVIRSLDGYDINGSGGIYLNSANWNSTSAITSIVIYPTVSFSFLQYSSYALYGIKGD